MKREVNAAVDFLLRLVQERGRVEQSRARRFADELRGILSERFSQHWYPANPSRGQAFRCIRINALAPCDEALSRACRASGLQLSELGLPPEITLWIDPFEVCARSRERCHPFIVASFRQEEEEEEEEAPPVPEPGSESRVQDTSDYHSASSSDCSSETFSESEEEEEGRKSEREPGAEKRDKGGIVMVPRPRELNKHPRTQAPQLQYFYQPAPVWPQLKKRRAAMFLTPVYPAPVLGYYVLTKQTPQPQFILPQASLQHWGAAKG
nr:PREDICTED: maternal B9.15 protein-like isoform X3 [Lepisosteus oculatus]